MRVGKGLKTPRVSRCLFSTFDSVAKIPSCTEIFEGNLYDFTLHYSLHTVCLKSGPLLETFLGGGYTGEV